MKCSVCSADAPKDSMFCPQCGARLAEHDAGDEPAPRPTPREQFTQRVSSRESDDDDTENELWEGGFSPKALFGTYLAAVLLTIGLVVLAVFVPPVWIGVIISVPLMWIVIGLIVVYRRMEISYRLTSQRFVHEHGILKRVTDRIEVIDMDDITFEQNLLERPLGVGTIRITSSDRTHPELMLRGIDDVKRVATLIDDVRRAERRRRGLHIESI